MNKDFFENSVLHIYNTWGKPFQEKKREDTISEINVKKFIQYLVEVLYQLPRCMLGMGEINDLSQEDKGVDEMLY